MNRRGFLGLIVAAPAIVRATSLMPGRPWQREKYKVTMRFGESYVDPRFFEAAAQELEMRAANQAEKILVPARYIWLPANLVEKAETLLGSTGLKQYYGGLQLVKTTEEMYKEE
jgi:hypothetical protein